MKIIKYKSIITPSRQTKWIFLFGKFDQIQNQSNLQKFTTQTFY